MKMTTARTLGVTMLALALASPLRAAEPSADRKLDRKRIAVTDFAIRADDASKGLAGLGLVVAAQLEALTGAEVITPADVAAMLDLEGRRLPRPFLWRRELHLH